MNSIVKALPILGLILLFASGIFLCRAIIKQQVKDSRYEQQIERRVKELENKQKILDEAMDNILKSLSHLILSEIKQRSRELERQDPGDITLPEGMKEYLENETASDTISLDHFIDPTNPMIDL